MKKIFACTLLTFLLFSGISILGQKRQQIILKDNWLVRELKAGEKLPGDLPADFSRPGPEWFNSSMPKQVQELILEKKILPDPHWGDNAAKWTYIFDQDWIYVTRFNSPESKNEVFLRFEGLDTRADIFLNGQKIAECNSMFRHFRFPVSKVLKPAGKKNLLLIHFYSPSNYINSISAKVGKQPYDKIKYLRKCYTDFGSYMGARPNFLKMGLFGDTYLDVTPASYFDETFIRTTIDNDHSHAKIIVFPDVKGSSGTKIDYILKSPDGGFIKQATVAVADSFIIDIEKPELWWPFTNGKPSLYGLTLNLIKGSAVIDRLSLNVGIREIQMYLKDEATGEDRFGFIVNGEKIFMHGACWAPLEGFTHVWNEARANRLLDLIVLGNMNILRVWGEGSLPGKSFYDECDKRGILVWQEFMTGGGMGYPLNFPGFRENIGEEAENMIKILRNHPCIAMWCGGNEHYLPYPSLSKNGEEPPGRELFQKIFPSLVARFDPGCYYHPSSPWGGEDWPNGNYPLTGDYHDYSTIRFQPLSSVPLFTSEACMVSPYSYHNMQRFMPEDDLWPKDFSFKIDKPGKIAWPDGWQKYTAAESWQKTGNIQDYIDIQNGEEACRIFGTAHGAYLQERYERQRHGTPDGSPDGNRRSWGAMIWRLNDTWPMIYMSVVDYYLEPKIPYYFLKRACEPLLVSFEQTSDRICTWVVNDSPKAVNDSLIIELWTFDGKMKIRKVWNVNIQPGQSKRIADLTGFYDILKRREFLVARLGNQVVTHLLWPEKYLMLPEAQINAVISDKTITLTSDKFVKEVELYMQGTSGAVFSDNYFNLIPGEPKTIEIIFLPENSEVLRIKGVNSPAIKLEL